MKNNIKTIWSVAKINFRQIIPAYIVTAVFIAIGIYNLIASVTGMTDNYYVDMANYLYVLTIMAPIIIVARDFKKMMHLNGNKKAFYWGAMLNYGIIAAGISLVVIIFFVLTKEVFGSQLMINNLVDIFGWWKHGVVIAFLQQFFFLLFTEVLIHTLTSIQTHWYGWVADGILLFVLVVFIPTPELRSILIRFFNLIIFQSNPLLQMISCLTLSVSGYLLYLPILRRKEL